MPYSYLLVLKGCKFLCASNFVMRTNVGGRGIDTLSFNTCRMMTKKGHQNFGQEVSAPPRTENPGYAYMASSNCPACFKVRGAFQHLQENRYGILWKANLIFSDCVKCPGDKGSSSPSCLDPSPLGLVRMLRRDHTVSPVATGLYRSIAVGWIRTQCRLLIAYVTLTLK